MNSIQDLRDCTDVALVGGKAANLGALLRAGFVVPDGFVMTTSAGKDDVDAMCHAYHQLNAPKVAVRSSAMIEDGKDFSMAGQFKTTLNVGSETELLDAVRLCRTNSEPAVKAKHYAAQPQGPSPMAVVIQRQVPADVAGVLFTQAPERSDEMLIEAAPGLGDAVVAGQTTPDAFRINAATGDIIESRCHRGTPCLTDAQIRKLWELGRDVASHFGSPQDIEWAICQDKLFLIQARPITTFEREDVRTNLIRTTREHLTQSNRGPWILHNLTETVPHPTPLTWSVLRRFVSGAGGFGAMYRRLGFDPAPNEILDLILGKIYLDLARAPGLFGKEFPFVYDADQLGRDPNAVHLPPSLPRGSLPARFRARRRLRQAERQIYKEGRYFDKSLSQQIIPDFTKWCAREKRRDLSKLAPPEWVALWREREYRIFEDFAPQILFTNFIAASALGRLRDLVAEHFWDESPGELTQLISSCEEPDETLLADVALREVAHGNYSLDSWLTRYGHRAIGEFDLAAPRWREIPEALLAYAQCLEEAPDPMALAKRKAQMAREKVDELGGGAALALKEQAELVRRYTRFREDGKHYLMLGYDLLRDMVLDASRRLNAEVVWLTADELASALHEGFAPARKIADRKGEFLAEKRIYLPQIIEGNDLYSLGEPPRAKADQQLKGATISNGFGSGQVRIVESPLDGRDLGKGYVLVCPSTDPQWTPLFLNASALVLERGGSLSHGAIIARELNLPAVALPDATRSLREGELVFVNGSTGVVSRGERSLAVVNTLSPAELPPCPGKRERFAARVRDIGLIVWSLFLTAVWSLPESWLRQPALHLLDKLFWPIVQELGPPIAVIIVGAGLAVLTACVQALLSDNARLREVRRRADRLTRQAATIPSDSPSRSLLIAITRQAHLRAFGNSLVPAGVLFGIFVLSFTWLTARMNTSNPRPGTDARVQVTVDSAFQGPITLSVAAPLGLDPSTTATRKIPPIQETLENLASHGNLPISQLEDLRNYLHRGVPPQTLTWLLNSRVAGSFPIAIAVGNSELIRSNIVFGDAAPPPDAQHFQNSKSPVRAVTIVAAAQHRSFWNLKALFPGLDREIGWIWFYLGAYLLIRVSLNRLMRLS